MAWATSTRQQVRQEVIRQLYAEENVIIGTASSGSTTTLIDVGAATTTIHLEYSALASQAYVGAWIYILQATPEERRITAFDGAAGQITFQPAGTAVTTQGYEIHYKIPPSHLNEMIIARARIASRGAIDAYADETTTASNLDKFVLTAGVLADCKRYLANLVTGPERDELLQEAEFHEADFTEGVRASGYGDNWLNPPPEVEEETAASLSGRI